MPIVMPPHGRETHRGIDAHAIADGGQACAIAEMRGDHAASGRFARDVLVGEPVKSVARERLHPPVLAASHKAGPRAACGDEKRCRSRPPAERPGCSRAIASMASISCGRCSGASGISALSAAITSGVTRRGRSILRSAVHHAMANHAQFEFAAPQPVEQRLERSLVPGQSSF